MQYFQTAVIAVSFYETMVSLIYNKIKRPVLCVFGWYGRYISRLGERHCYVGQQRTTEQPRLFQTGLTDSMGRRLMLNGWKHVFCPYTTRRCNWWSRSFTKHNVGIHLILQHTVFKITTLHGLLQALQVALVLWNRLYIQRMSAWVTCCVTQGTS